MSVGDERNKINDIVKAYATHYHKTSVTWFRIVELKKIFLKNPILRLLIPTIRVDTSTTVLKTIGSLEKRDAIKAIYGKEIANEMLSFTASDKSLHLDINAYCSNQSYEGKKLQFILFINGRLVNCKTIRQTIESTFGTFLVMGEDNNIV